jgi:small multidrug resistance pump
MSPVTSYLCLAGAIITEAIATITLAASESLTKPLPTIISVVCFVAAFWLLSFPLRTMPTGIVYAVWSGLGIVLITAIAWVWTKQALDIPAIVGMALIAAGVIVINVFSKSEVPAASAEAEKPGCSAAKSPSARCE